MKDTSHDGKGPASHLTQEAQLEVLGMDKDPSPTWRLHGGELPPLPLSVWWGSSQQFLVQP
jgi:hypothetical protein